MALLQIGAFYLGLTKPRRFRCFHPSLRRSDRDQLLPSETSAIRTFAVSYNRHDFGPDTSELGFVTGPFQRPACRLLTIDTPRAMKAECGQLKAAMRVARVAPRSWPAFLPSPVRLRLRGNHGIGDCRFPISDWGWVVGTGESSIANLQPATGLRLRIFASLGFSPFRLLPFVRTVGIRKLTSNAEVGGGLRNGNQSQVTMAATENGVPAPHSPTEMSSLFSKAGLMKKRASARMRRISVLSEAMRFVWRACRNTPRTPVWASPSWRALSRAADPSRSTSPLLSPRPKPTPLPRPGPRQWRDQWELRPRGEPH